MVLEFATRVADSSSGSKWHHFCHVSAEDAKSSLARSRTLFERSIVHRPAGIGKMAWSLVNKEVYAMYAVKRVRSIAFKCNGFEASDLKYFKKLWFQWQHPAATA